MSAPRPPSAASGSAAVRRTYGVLPPRPSSSSVISSSITRVLNHDPDRPQTASGATVKRKDIPAAAADEDAFSFSSASRPSSASIFSVASSCETPAASVVGAPSRPSSGYGSQPLPPKRTVIFSSTALPTRADQARRFHAVESCARGAVLAEESDSRSILSQQRRGALYMAREKELIKRRLPSAEVIAAAAAAASASPKLSPLAAVEEGQDAQNEKDQDDILMREILGGVVPYQSYTSRAGRLFSSRAKQQQQQNALSREEKFELNLRRATNHGGAFLIDSPAVDKKKANAEDKEKEIGHPMLTPRSSARFRLEATEQMERAIFVATVFLPEALRLAEDGEAIGRSATEERRRAEMEQDIRPAHAAELKPLLHEWRRREHAAVTIQYATRKVQRGLGGLGWRRTHKELGGEIEAMRSDKKKKKQQQQQQHDSSASSAAAAHPPPPSAKTRFLSRIDELNREEQQERVQRHLAQRRSLDAAAAKDRADVAFEERWALQRQMQDMSSLFFDAVTKPSMLRVGREETDARHRFSAAEVEPLLRDRRADFSAQRMHIQRKNDLEALEAKLRAGREAEEEQRGFERLQRDSAEHRADTQRRVQQRHSAERAELEAAEAATRVAVCDAMTAAFTQSYSWHCSVVDDSLQRKEVGERALLQHSFLAERSDMVTAQTAALLGGGVLAGRLLHELSLVTLQASVEGLVTVWEPLLRRKACCVEEEEAEYLFSRLSGKAAVISKDAARRVQAACTIQNRFWRAHKAGDLGRSGRLKYYDERFASKKRAAAKRRAQELVAQTQADLERALRDANIFIVAGFSQKLRLLQKQEARGREDLEVEDGLMRNIFDANMVSAINATCVSETTVLARFEAHHRFLIMQEERAWHSKYLTFMQLVFVKDVKIRPAQRATRCFLARQERRRRIAAALSDMQHHAEPLRRAGIEMACVDTVAGDLFMGQIMPALHRVSFASATFVWLVEQERAARECVWLERKEAARGYLGWLASLGTDALAEEQQQEFRQDILGAWRKQVFFLDLFELEVSARSTVVKRQSEQATHQLLTHAESMRRTLASMAVEAQSYKLAMAAVELHEFTQRTIIDRDGASVGFQLLCHLQEADQRCILERGILQLADLNTGIYHHEQEARQAVQAQWAKGCVVAFGELEQGMRFTLMQREFESREQLRLLAFEDDWRIDVSVTRRYELLMLLELAESSRRRVLLAPEMRALEAIVDFDRDCIRKKFFLYESDYCHGMRAVLEAQQHEQRTFIAADQLENTQYLQEQVDIAAQMDLQSQELKLRGEEQHLEQAKFEHIIRSHTRLARNANYRDADAVWRNAATRALLGNGLAPQQQQQAITSSSSSTSFIYSAMAAAKDHEQQQEQQQQQQQQYQEKEEELRHDVQSDFAKITHELLWTLRNRVMMGWLRTRATDLALLHHQSQWEAAVAQIQKTVISSTNMMHGMLARDPFHQTMKLVYGLQCARDELWAEQAGELATTVLASDAWLMPSYVSLFDAEVRGNVFDRLLQRRERGVVELHEDEELFRIRSEERHLRRMLLLVEAERAERHGFNEEERAAFEQEVHIYQDTILKPLENLRLERQLRAEIVRDEAEVRGGDMERPFAGELVLCWGPQRAWNLLRHGEGIKKAAADRSSFLRQEERRRKARAALDATATPDERAAMAVRMMQGWARRRLWTSTKTAADDRAVAGAMAVADSLQVEAFSAIDVRDRYERLRYCAVLLQKVFRGHRVRNPDMEKRIAAARAAKTVKQQQQQKQQQDVQDKDLDDVLDEL